MAVRVNEVNQVTQVPDAQKTQAGDGSFKFTLASAITDADLQAKVDALMQDITAQGNRIAEHMDIRDMKRYRGLIKHFLNEVVYRSHKFSRENFLDRRGRHRVYGIIAASRLLYLFLWYNKTDRQQSGRAGIRAGGG